MTRRTAGKKGNAPAIADCIARVCAEHDTGSATEHSHRRAFENLFPIPVSPSSTNPSARNVVRATS